MQDTLGRLQKQLNSGTVSLVVLALLERSGQPMYGYQISKVLESLADDSLPMKQGTFYPVLRSLEREGQLESSLEPSDAGPQRRYYCITELGRQVARGKVDRMEALVRAAHGTGLVQPV